MKTQICCVTIFYSSILLIIIGNFLSWSTVQPYLTKYEGRCIKLPRDACVAVVGAVAR